MIHNRYVGKVVKKQKCIAGPDEDYGAIDSGIGVIDMSPEEYDAKKTAFLKKIYLTIDEIVKIERNTVGQQENDDWKKLRKQRLTASNFGRVCKLRPTTSRANTVKYILYDIFQGCSSTRFVVYLYFIYFTIFYNCIYYYFYKMFY